MSDATDHDLNDPGSAGKRWQRCAGFCNVARRSQWQSCCCLARPLHEAAPAPAALSQPDLLELQRIAAYLNGIRTMTAHFQQVANNGGVSTGRLWVARPGACGSSTTRPTRSRCSPTRPRLLFRQAAQSDVEVRAEIDPGLVLSARPDQFRSRRHRHRVLSEGNLVRVTVVETAAARRRLADSGIYRKSTGAAAMDRGGSAGKDDERDPVRSAIRYGARSQAVPISVPVYRRKPLKGTNNKSENRCPVATVRHWHSLLLPHHQRAPVPHRQCALSDAMIDAVGGIADC